MKTLHSKCSFALSTYKSKLNLNNQDAFPQACTYVL